VRINEVLPELSIHPDLAKKLNECVVHKKKKQGYLYIHNEYQENVSQHPLLYDCVSYSDDKFEE